MGQSLPEAAWHKTMYGPCRKFFRAAVKPAGQQTGWRCLAGLGCSPGCYRGAGSVKRPLPRNSCGRWGEAWPAVLSSPLALPARPLTLGPYFFFFLFNQCSYFLYISLRSGHNKTPKRRRAI